MSDTIRICSQKHFTVYVYCSLKGVHVKDIAVRQNMSLTDAGSFAQAAIDFCKFDIHSRPDCDCITIEIADERACIELFEVNK